MNLAKIVTHLAVRYPLVDGSDNSPFFGENFYALLSEIVAASGSLKFPFWNLGVFFPKFFCVNQEDLAVFEEKLPSIAREDCEHLFITMEVPYEEEKDVESFLPQVLTKSIYDFIIVCNLCYPGMFDLVAFEMAQNGNLVNTFAPEMDSFSLQCAALYAKEQKWPHFRSLKIIDAWEWLLQRKNYLEKEGFDNDPISRALNAFSRLFESPGKDFTLHLVWAMVGIEALFVREDEKVNKQIREGIRNILGYHPSFHEEFKRMYGFRSRFIHGGVDFPGLFYLGDGSEGLEKYDKDQDRTVSCAVAILIASLQGIISGSGRIPPSP